MGTLGLFKEINSNEPEQVHRTVVRVKTDYYTTGGSVVEKRSIKSMRRLCEGHNSLDEHIANLDPIQVLSDITNFRDVQDGVYEMVLCDISIDYETGYADEWNYKLVPYE